MKTTLTLLNSVKSLNSGARKMIRASYLGLLVFLMIFSFNAQAQNTIVTTIGNVSGCPGQDVLVPVNVTNFNDITSISIKIKYDTSMVTALNVLNVNPLALTNSTYVPNIFVQNDTGFVAISLFKSAGSMTIGNGHLCDIKFHIKNFNSFTRLMFNTQVFGDCEYSDLNYVPITDVLWVDGSVFTEPSFAINSTNQTILPGNNGYFYVTAMGNNTFQWQVSTNGGTIWTNLVTGAPYGDVTNDTLFITNATIGINGYKYRSVITNISVGCPAPYNVATSNSSLLTVAVSCPTVFNVTGGGSFCLGGSGVHVFLSGSEVGVNYQLKHNTVNVGAVVAGTGLPIDFGAQTVLGTYTITGSNANLCSPVTMAGNAVVANYYTTNGNITGSATICGSATTPITLTLNGFKPFDVIYSDGISQIAINAINANNYYFFVNPTITTTYTLISAIDGHGCNLTITGSPAVITIKPTPTAVASSNSPVCSGQTINLSSAGSSGGISYTWTFNGVPLSGPNPTIPNATTANSGNYILTASGANGCTAIDTTTVIVNTIPAAAGTISGPPAVCKLSSVTYTVGAIAGAVTYNWTLPIGASITSGSGTNSIVVLFSGSAVSGNINISGHSDCGDGAVSANFAVTVNNLPTPTAGNSGPVCAGATLNLTSSGGLAYLWSGPNSFASTIQNPSLTGTTVAMTGQYTVMVTNAEGCSATANTTATVNANPVATAGSNSPVCSGSFLSLTSGGGNSYLWSGPNAFTSTLQNPTLTPVNLGSAGTYTVTVTNTTTTCKSTASTVVTVNTAPPINVSDNDPCEGTTLILAASGGVSYSWSGPNSFSSTLQNPNISNVTIAAGGTYNVLVTGSNGCIATTSTNVVIHAKPLASAGTDQNINANQTTTLTGSASGGSGSYTWNWQPAAMLVNSTVQNPTTVALASTTIFTLIVTDQVTNCVSIAQQVTIHINQNPFTVVITAPSVPPGQNYITITEGASVALDAVVSYGVGPFSYEWSSLPAGFTSTISNPLVSPTVTTTYYVTVTDHGFSPAPTAAASFTVYVEPALSSYIIVYPGTSVCVGSTVSFMSSTTGGTGVYTYSWTGPNGFTSTIMNPVINNITLTDAGVYTLSVNDGVNTANATPVILTVNPGATLFSMTSGGSYCQGTLGVVVGLNGSEIGTSYQLLQNGNPLGLPFNGTGNAIIFGTYTAGLYTVTGTNTCGTVEMSGSALITETPLPIEYTLSGGGMICDATSVVIHLDGSETGTTYNVYLDNNLTAISSPGTGNPLDYAVFSPGVYTIVAVNNCGSVEMIGAVYVFSGSTPTAYTVQGGSVICPGNSGTVTLAGSHTNTTYQLYLNGAPIGTPVDGTGEMLDFNITTAGTYTIVATNNCGTVPMNGSATFTLGASSIVFNVSGGGTICVGGNGFAIGLDGSENGTIYTLYLYGAPLTQVITGNGNPITFGLQTIPGTYTVQAGSSCGNVMMNGNAIITVNTYPAAFTVTGGGSLCSNSIPFVGQIAISPYPVVGLSGSETGVTYELYINGTPSGQATISGTGNAISFGEQFSGGIYTIIATNGCGTTPMTGDATVTLVNPPAIFNMTGGAAGPSCVLTESSVGLDGSEFGVVYTLYLDGINTGNDVVGTGAAIDFGLFSDPGTYTAIATNSASCTSDMYGSASIIHLPSPVILLNPANTNVLEGGNASFTVSAASTSIYLWYESMDGGLTWTPLTDGGIYSGTSTPILHLTGVLIGMNTYQYRATLADGICEVNTTAATLNVISTGSVITVAFEQLSYCPGEIIVPILVTNFFNVAAASLVMNYDPSVITYTGFQNVNSLLNDPGTMLVNASNGSLLISHYTLTPSNIGTGTLLELVFQYNGGTTNLNWDLATPGNCLLSDFYDNTLNTLFYNGSISQSGALAVLNTQPVNTNVNLGDNATFNVTATGAATYQWQVFTSSWVDLVEAAPYSGTQTANLLITGVTSGMNGNHYRVIVKDAVCLAPVYSNQAILSIISPTLDLTTTAANVTACGASQVIVPISIANLSDVAAISLRLTYDPAVISYVNYQNLNPAFNAFDVNVFNVPGDWRLSWFSLTPVSVASVTLLDLVFDYYGGSTTLNWETSIPGFCEYDDIDGNAITAFYVNGSVTPSGSQPVITTYIANATVNDGDNASFTVVANNVTTYQWQVSTDGLTWFNLINNTVYSGVNTATLNITPAIITMDNYNYRVILANGNCSTTSNAAMLHVTPLGGSIITTAANVTACTGMQVTVPVTVQYLYNVAAISLTLHYDPATISYITYNNLNPQLLSGTINLFDIPGEWKFSWYSLTPISIGTGGLFDLIFTYNGGNTDLTWDITNSGNCEYDDFGGNILPATYINGHVGPSSDIPVLIGQPANLTVTHHDNAEFHVVANFATAYQWQVSTNGGISWMNLTDGGHYSGTTTADLYITNALYLFNGYQYRNVVTRDICYTISNAATLTVLPILPWTVTTIAPTINVCPGTDIIVPINVTDFYNVAANSLTLDYDNTVITYTGYQNLNPAMADALISPTPGQFKFSWYSLTPLSLGDATIVELLFHYNGGSTNLTWDLVTSGNNEYNDFNGNIMLSAFVDGMIGSSAVAPVIITQPIDVTSFVGSPPVTFTVDANFATSYQWQVSMDGGNTWANLSDVAPYSGVNTNTLTIDAQNVAMNGYQYRAFIGGTCTLNTTSNAATLTVNSVIITIAGDVVSCVGNSILVPISVEHLLGVAAMSLTLNYDDTNLTYVGFQDVNPLIDQGLLLVNASNGQVKIGYFNVNPLNIGNGMIMNLIFSSNGGYSDLIWDSITPGNCEYQDIVGGNITGLYINGSVLVHPLPVLTFDNIGPFCIDGDAITLTALPLGGTFSGNGVSEDMFNPAVAGIGTWTITYAYTDEFGCSNTIDIQVTVNPLPVVTFDAAGPFCVDAVATLVGNPAGGTFSGPGVVGNTFNASIAGTGTFTLWYTYADANGCVNYASIDVVVNPLPIVSFDPIGPFCSNVAPVVLSGSPAGGTFSGNGVSGNVFDPGIAGVGTWVLTYTYTDENGCTNSATITVDVNVIPTAFPVFGGGEYCTGGTGLNIGTGGSQAGFEYYLYLDGNNTGQMIVGTGSILNFGPQLLAGTYTIYAMNPGTGCNNWLNGSVTITINPLPNVYGGGYTIICQGTSTTINAVVNGGTSPYLYSWTPAGSLSSPYVLNPVASPSVTTFYQLVVTDAKGCSSSDNALVVVNAAPVVSAGPDKVINIGMITPLNASVSSGHAPYTYLWTPAIGLNNANVLIPLASPVVTTTYTLVVTDNVGCSASDQVTVTVTSTPLGYNISGFVTYDNIQSSPMSNTNVLLEQNNIVVNTTVTNIAGSYGFTLIANGLYSITGSTTKAWGGGNSVDALIMARYFVGLQSLTGLKLLAGDLDGNGVVNAADALLVMRRSVLLINSFSVGDWLFETKTANVNNGNLAIDFKALCFGDVNGSNVPALKISPSITINMEGSMAVENNKVLELPIRAGENLSLGAASLVISYPANAIDILDVMVSGNNQTSNLVYTVQDSRLFIEWYNLTPLTLAANDVLFTLKVKVKDITAIENMTFSIEGESQLADPIANVLTDALLTMPKLQVINVAFSLGDNYPNPFNQFTTITYTTPENGNVNLSVYNMIGEKVAELVNADQNSGNYSVTLDGAILPQGVYTYRLRVEGTTQTFDQSKRMIISR